MSIQTEIERLENAKSALKTSITNKGVIVDEGKKLNEYSALVDSIVELKGQTKTVVPSTSEQTISPDAQYNGLTSVTVNAVTSAIDSNIVADNIKKDVSILGVTGTYAPEEGIDTSDATATANQILEGATAYVNGEKITGTVAPLTNTGHTSIGISSLEDISVPDSHISLSHTFDEAEMIQAGDRVTFDVQQYRVAGKAGITGDKIMAGNTILSVEGTATADANATADDIVVNKTAYVNGQKITGTLSLFPNTSTFTVDNAGVTNNTEDSTLELTTINTLKQTLDSNLNMKFSAPYADITTAIGLTADKIVSGNTILNVVGTASTGTTPDVTISNEEYGLETVTSGEGDNDTGYKFYTNANVQSKLYETGSIVEVHITNELLAQVLGITADKIKVGETIAGVIGTYDPTQEAQQQINELNNTISESNELAEDILGTNG